jgi:hypothetical protein
MVSSRTSGRAWPRFTIHCQAPFTIHCLAPLILTLLLVALVSQSVAAAPIFQFHRGDVWLNLHHFLYVLGRAEATAPDIGRRAVANAPAEQDLGLGQLTDAEQKIWKDAVTFYATSLSTQDAIFDNGMIEVTGALARVGEGESLATSGVDPKVVAVLERAAPIYRKQWWPAHRAANDAWVTSTTAWVNKHGDAVLAFITRAYGLPWPANGYPIHISGYANWAGAYSTRGDLLVISSLDSGNRDATGLEIVFHEAMHQWDDQMFRAVRDPARQQGKLVPAGLTHALIWHTAAEAVKRVVPGYVGYAEAGGMWQRIGFKPALDAAWLPWLNGHGSRDAALAALVKAIP